jgi:hypothetical protein
MTSPALQERREVVKAARRDAELAQRFHDRQWHKRHRVRPKPLSLEGPTNAEHIALYQLEKERYQARRAPIVADEIERVRAAIAKLEENIPQRERDRRKRTSAAAKESNARRRPPMSPTHYRCGHERTPENTYTRKRKAVGGEKLKSNTECKTCAQARDRASRVSRYAKLPAGMPTAYGA